MFEIVECQGNIVWLASLDYLIVLIQAERQVYNAPFSFERSNSKEVDEICAKTPPWFQANKDLGTLLDTLRSR